MAVVGAPSREVASTYAAVREITQATVSRIRPGMTAADVADVCNEESRSRGIPPKAAGRLGHGIGLTTSEPPSLMAGDDTVLEPGMVFTVEPGILRDYGYFVLEETVAVTETGVDLLTPPSPPDPYRI
jgi:Xaa-Pro aminopeptidase